VNNGWVGGRGDSWVQEGEGATTSPADRVKAPAAPLHQPWGLGCPCSQPSLEASHLQLWEASIRNSSPWEEGWRKAPGPQPRPSSAHAGGSHRAFFREEGVYSRRAEDERAASTNGQTN